MHRDGAAAAWKGERGGDALLHEAKMKSQGQLRQGVNGSVPLCTPLLGRDPAKPTRVSQYHVRDQIHHTQTTTTGQTLFSPLLAILVHTPRMDESAVHALCLRL